MSKTELPTPSTKIRLSQSGCFRLSAACIVGALLADAVPAVGAPFICSNPSSVIACEGNTAAFSVVATSNGNCAPADPTGLTYQWRKNGVNLTDGGSIFGATSATLLITPVAMADAATSANGYDVVVTGAGSVTSSPRAALDVNPRPATPTSVTATQLSVCVGHSTNLSAVVGGSETIDWYEGTCGGTVIGMGSPVTVTPVATTTYYARARNTSTGCISAVCGSVTITVNSNPTAAITPDPAVVCAGVSVVLHGTPAGGSGTFSTHAWTGDTTPLSSTSIENPTFLTNTPGTYNLTYTVTDSNGCTGFDTIAVLVNPLPVVPTGVTASPPAICFGFSTVLSATVGAGGDVLEWFEGSCGGTPVVGQSPTVSPTSTTTYYVRSKTTATGCVSDCVPVTVTVNPLPAIPSNEAASPSTICNGQSSTLSATVGAGGDVLEWFEGSCGGTPVVGQSPIVSPTSTTTYYVRSKTTATGCVSDCVPVTVNVNPLPATPTAALATPSAICTGQSSTLSATVGAGGDVLEWFEGSCGGTPVVGQSPTVSPTSTTTYYVRSKTTATGCVSDCVPVTVTVNPLPAVPSSELASPGTICNGQSSTLSATVGAGGDVLEWFVGSCGGTPVVGQSPIVSPTSTTTYYVRSKTTATGCVSDCVPVTVNVNPLPATPTAALATPSAICFGHSSSLTATVGGGEDVDWYTGSCGGTPVGSGSPLSVSPGSTTTYFARARNTSTGCVSAACASVTVTVNSNPTATASPNPGSICADGTLQLHGSPAGGSGGFLHAWTGDTTYLSATNIENPTFHYTGPALVLPAAPLIFNLTYTVTDSNGCTGTDSTTVTVYPLPNCTITAATQVSANSTGNIASVLTAGPGATYVWTVTGGSITGGQGTSTLTYTAGAGPGNVQIQVSVQTSHGCTCSNAGILVPIHSGPATLTLGFDKDCYKPGETVTATLSMSGLGTPAAGFQAFLNYNPTYLTFVSWTYTAAPFGLHVLNTAGTVNPTTGDLNLAGGIDQVGGQTPSSANALLVTLTFQIPLIAPNNCTASGLLTFRSHIPPTRLTDAFANELLPLTLTPPQTVVIDGTPPTVTAGSIASCYPDVASAQSAALAATTAHDNCTADANLVTTVSTVGTCSAVVTVTVKDCSGNMSSVNYNTVIDNDTPVINLPATEANLPPSVTVQCSSDVPASDITKVVVTDACPVTVTVADVDAPLGPHTCSNYVITRTYTATDGCSHSATYVQTITVHDTTVPIITAPANTTVSCAASVPPHDFAGGTASDNCGTPTVTWEGDVITPGSCANRYTIARTYKATDACGLTATATQTITVNDSTNPVLTVPPAVTIQCDESLIPALPWGSVDGGVAIYYQNDGDGEVPTNQSYLKTQYSATNSHGAAFTFSSVPLTGGGLTWAILFGQVGPPTQYGFDMVLPALDPGPVLNAYNNFDNSLAGRALVGPVTWAFNDYKDSAPNGPQNPANDIVNSLVRTLSPGTPATDVVITKNVLTHPDADTYVVDIAGKLHSDGLIHWYNPATPDTNMAVFSLNGDFYFAGTLTYHISTDLDPLQDFYAGTLTILANSPNAALGFATATDNCDPFPVISYTDAVTPGACPNAKTVVRTWKAIDSCGNIATGNQTITVVDNTPPTIVCPPNLAFQCAASVPAHATDALSFVGQGGTVSDNCDPNPTVEWVSDDIVPLAHCPNQFTITRTYKAKDACGNEATCAQTIVVNDDTKPVIHCPANVTVQCASLVPAHATDLTSFLALGTGASVSDNCDPAPVLTWEGDVISGLTCVNRYTITRTYKATDSCGNFDTCSQTITVNDTTAPVFAVTCPMPTISVNSDAGHCYASAAAVNAVAPAATDNCDTPTVTGTRSDALALSANYPQGNTVITWTATDICGNSATCQQTVHVSSVSEVIVSVELSPTVETSLNRCITFQVWDCGLVTPTYTTGQVLTFTSGKALNVSLLVPCGPYTCITARDKLHTLRRTLSAPDFKVVGTQYVADFINATGGNKQLIGGNLNDDAFIDILDFGVYAGQYSHHYPGGMLPDTGDTTCSTLAPHADISGNGVAFTEDFTFLAINFLKVRDANCCGNANIASSESGQPLSTISVAELKVRGLTDLAAADLNGDGVVDAKDIALWASGVRPGQTVPTTPPKRAR